MIGTPQTPGDTTASATPHGRSTRMIDHWFPCAAVDKAVTKAAGSGLSEKALFTWFASRPIAQARAAVLTSLLPDDEALHDDVTAAVEHSDQEALARLRKAIEENYPNGQPVVVDVFSGRGIIPLEAARLGVRAVGTDLSPVATLATRLLIDYPHRDWSTEPPLPFAHLDNGADIKEEPQAPWLFDGPDLPSAQTTKPRLLRDIRAVIGEVGKRAHDLVAHLYPKNPDGRLPWAYLWAITIPCDQCKNRFPLVGSMVLRHPYNRTGDCGQALRLVSDGTSWHTEIIDGTVDQQPPFAAAPGKKGKVARCIHCGHTHSLDSVKAKGFNQDYSDALLAVADGDADGPKKTWRVPTSTELNAVMSVSLDDMPMIGPLSAIPNEVIGAGNNDTVRASAYGYRTYGDLMNTRQSLQTYALVASIRRVRQDLIEAGLSQDYANALAAYAASNLVRKLRRSTRGADLDLHGNPHGTVQNRIGVGDVYADQSKVRFAHDYLEAGPGEGPGTWGSVAESGFNALAKIIAESPNARAGTARRASAVALPFRDGTVNAVVTDPPYYNMIDYADASDLFHVWLKRILFDVFPDLFGREGLQDKSEEIIVKRGNAPGEHRTKDFYEQMLSRAFVEAKRVLRPDGHLVVVFGHSDPDAWRRLLGALHDAGFVVTSSWPSRTESANTSVATIRVTVTIGCQVAQPNRPVATAAQVDREVSGVVKAACRQWDRDELALADQLMAAYGPAMSVYGRYSKVLKPDGTPADLDRYIALARIAVREATALRLDELPLETFDAPTRFAVFWQRVHGQAPVPKGEARFFAQADELRLEDLRGRLLVESKGGYKLRLDAPDAVSERSSTFEVARAIAAAWEEGGTEAAATVLARAEMQASDPHLWAVIGEIVSQLPSSDRASKALTAVQRNATTIGSLVHRVAEVMSVEDPQLPLIEMMGETLS